jgi:hypothetical protein
MTRDPYPQIAHITHGYFSGLLRDCASLSDPGAAAHPETPATPTLATSKP